MDFSLTPTPVGGGVGGIKGTVKSSSSGPKLGGVLVQVVGGPSATTNKSGKYNIGAISEGPQSLIASHPDYSDTAPIPVTDFEFQLLALARDFR